MSNPSNETVLTFLPGSTPLLITVPHGGTVIPDDVRGLLHPAVQERLRQSPPWDTDHFVDQLYSFAKSIGAGLLVAQQSRWVVDLNRPPDDQPLYPGQAGTGLVPETDFDGAPLWCRPLTEADIHRRREAAFLPWHRFLRETLDGLREQFGHAVLWDAHSIRDEVPRLFDGKLPDLNLGTNSGASCSPALRAQVAQALQHAGPWSHVVDGRFRGGYITRHYGQPELGIHALQLELAQSCYMPTDMPIRWDASVARPLQAALETILREVAQWRP